MSQAASQFPIVWSYPAARWWFVVSLSVSLFVAEAWRVAAAAEPNAAPSTRCCCKEAEIAWQREMT